MLSPRKIDSIYNAFSDLIREKKLIIAYELHTLDRILLSYSNPLLSKDKVNWIRRKRNVVLAFGMSSKDVAIKNNEDISAFCQKYAYSVEDMTLTAGSVPIIDDNGYLIGALTVTGLSPDEDHDLAVLVLSQT